MVIKDKWGHCPPWNRWVNWRWTPLVRPSPRQSPTGRGIATVVALRLSDGGHPTSCPTGRPTTLVVTPPAVMPWQQSPLRGLHLWWRSPPPPWWPRRLMALRYPSQPCQAMVHAVPRLAATTPWHMDVVSWDDVIHDSRVQRRLVAVWHVPGAKFKWAIEWRCERAVSCEPLVCLPTGDNTKNIKHATTTRHWTVPSSQTFMWKLTKQVKLLENCARIKQTSQLQIWSNCARSSCSSLVVLNVLPLIFAWTLATAPKTLSKCAHTCKITSQTGG